MNHTEILQYLIDKHNYKSYLEIGTLDGYNFDAINIEHKECCDVESIYPNLTYHMSSDEMFARMPIDKKYDIIFIDGMHDEEYVDKDIINSLKHLNECGLICLHDTIPLSQLTQTKYETYDGLKAWNGDVWKSITKLQNYNIEFYTIINEDSGLTIIKYKNNPYHLEFTNDLCTVRYDYVFTYDTNIYNRLTEQGKYIMHAITEEEFLNKF